MHQTIIQQAADLIQQADALLIAAGAGMGIDSGLPDFRGPEGFWNAYPGLRAHGLTFTDMANPRAFVEHPRLAWGFYGHRLKLYRQTRPHAGFKLLLDWAINKIKDSFIFTSNVDGQFQYAGFSEKQIYEYHGSIHHLQCTADCGLDIWSASKLRPTVDTERCRLLSELPHCPQCNALARPNILMFDDWQWDDSRSNRQAQRLNKWQQQCNRAVLIELGAGTTVPTVRYFSEQSQYPVIRINPDESDISGQAISLSMGALPALRAINHCY